MRSRADAVIIGGGIVGLSVAFNLARLKYGQVLLVEKEQILGAGATSKAAGGIRAQFSTKINIQMSMLSQELFGNFEELTGHDALFDQVGYMFLLSDDADIAQFKKSNELQKSLGLEVTFIEPDEITELAPSVFVEDIALASYCPADGLGDPHEFLTGFAKAARERGVEFAMETELMDISMESGKVSGVTTNRGKVSTPLVINCAGPQARRIGRMIGSKVEVIPLRRQIVTTGELNFIGPSFPMVVDVKSGLYCHKESKGLLLGWADRSVGPSEDISVDPDYTDAILEKAMHRIPRLAEAEMANQWAGLYETTPDNNAIIGYDSNIQGAFHVTGFSGHGFMHAPAAGQITAEIIVGKKPTIDISSLAPDRFATGALTEETNVI